MDERLFVRYCRGVPESQFADADDRRMRSQYLLGKRRTGAPHSNDEYASLRPGDLLRCCAQPFAVVKLDYPRDAAGQRLFVMRSVDPPHQFVGAPVIRECLVE